MPWHAVKWPESNALRMSLYWLTSVWVCRLMLALRTPAANLEGAFGEFFESLILTYTFGAAFSDLPPIAFLAFVATVVYMSGILFRLHTLAQLGLAGYLSLSLFSFWLEDYFSLVGAATSVVMTLVAAPFDLMMTIIFGVACLWLLREMEVEFAPRQQAAAMAEEEPLLLEAEVIDAEVLEETPPVRP
jgi:hypothetical protein